MGMSAAFFIRRDDPPKIRGTLIPEYEPAFVLAVVAGKTPDNREISFHFASPEAAKSFVERLMAAVLPFTDPEPSAEPVQSLEEVVSAMHERDKDLPF